MTEPYLRKGDVVGCALDLAVPVMTFYLNGVKVKGNFKNMNLDGMFFPVVSCSARIRSVAINNHRSLLIYQVFDLMILSLYSCRFLFGGEHGRLRFPPPFGFSPLYECLLPTQTLTLDPCFHFGDLTKSTLAGPIEVLNDTAFVPQPVDTTMVSRDKWHDPLSTCLLIPIKHNSCQYSYLYRSDYSPNLH